MPLAIFISIPFITVVYILVNISYLTLLSPSDIIASQAVANDWGTRLLSSSNNPTLEFLRYDIITIFIIRKAIKLMRLFCGTT